MLIKVEILRLESLIGFLMSPTKPALRREQGEKAMKSLVVVAIAIAVLVGACRREVPYTPMKLGADAAARPAIPR